MITDMGASRLQHFTLILLSVFLIFGALYFARALLIPIVFAMLLSMLILPLCVKMERKLPRWLAALCCTLIFTLILLGLIFLFSWQIINFADNLQKYKGAVHSKIQRFQEFVSSKANVSEE